MTVVSATGSPEALGRAHGEQTAAGIASALRLYEEISGMREAMTATGPYIDAARSALPHLVAEMQGLAEGAGRSFEEIAFLNCMEEVFDIEACVTVATGRFLIHAEQWYGGHDDIALIVAQPEDGIPFVSPTCAGFLPAVGLSAAGFAQGIDSLTASDDRMGIPRVFVSRHSLGATSLREAVDAARIDNRAGGYAHVLATSDETRTVETTASRSEVLDGVSAHTNHYLGTKAKDIATPATDGSLARYVRVKELLEGGVPRSLSECVRLLADHGDGAERICRHPTSAVSTTTVFGMICDLVEGTVAVSDGPPCRGLWSEVDVPMFRDRETTRVE